MEIIALNHRWIVQWRWLLLILFALFMLIGLAAWQWQRALTKAQLVQRITALEQQGNFTVAQWQALTTEELDARQISARGHWLAPHVWLLDNQIVDGRFGYDVLIPVQMNAGGKPILVNLGCVMAPLDRAQLPSISIPAELQVQGMIRTHWNTLKLGQNIENKGVWPMRAQQVDPEKMSAYLKQPLYPAVIYQLQNSPYKIHYHALVMSPDRHKAYALQWALLAFAVIIIAIAASAQPVKAKSFSRKGALQ